MTDLDEAWSSPAIESPGVVSLGRAISIVRCANYMTTEQLAQNSDIELNRMKLLERGSASVTLAELFTIARVLSTRTHTLIQLADILERNFRTPPVVRSPIY